MPQPICKPEEKVPSSGIYAVVHDKFHLQEHEVTAVIGEHFPPCNHCGSQVRFRLVRPTQHMMTHEAFQHALPFLLG
jgi:hypothetical protein